MRPQQQKPTQTKNFHTSPPSLFFPTSPPITAFTTPPTMSLLPTEHTHLSRISTTLSTTFLAFRLATWHTHIRDAHTSGPQIMLYLSATKPFRRHGWWSMFPSHIVGLDDVENKNAVLTTMSVLDIGHFTRLVGQMFEGA
jgi:hypothetical protein